MLTLCFARLWVHDLSVSYKITASRVPGLSGHQRPGETLPVWHTRLVSALAGVHGRGRRTIDLEKIFINIPVPKKGVAAGDSREPATPLIQQDENQRQTDFDTMFFQLCNRKSEDFAYLTIPLQTIFKPVWFQFMT